MNRRWNCAVVFSQHTALTAAGTPVSSADVVQQLTQGGIRTGGIDASIACRVAMNCR